jgi:hypothetical protein
MDHNSSARGTLMESLFNHIVLPPTLPGKPDGNRADIQRAVTERLLDASRVMRTLAADGLYRTTWDSICRSLQTCRTCNAGGRLDKTSLRREFAALTDGETMILHLSEQNCGLLVRKRSE